MKIGSAVIIKENMKDNPTGKLDHSDHCGIFALAFMVEKCLNVECLHGVRHAIFKWDPSNIL
jgi:hypothetical protein